MTTWYTTVQIDGLRLPLASERVNILANVLATRPRPASSVCHNWFLECFVCWSVYLHFATITVGQDLAVFNLNRKHVVYTHASAFKSPVCNLDLPKHTWLVVCVHVYNLAQGGQSKATRSLLGTRILPCIHSCTLRVLAAVGDLLMTYMTWVNQASCSSYAQWCKSSVTLKSDRDIVYLPLKGARPPRSFAIYHQNWKWRIRGWWGGSKTCCWCCCCWQPDLEASFVSGRRCVARDTHTQFILGSHQLVTERCQLRSRLSSSSSFDLLVSLLSEWVKSAPLFLNYMVCELQFTF